MSLARAPAWLCLAALSACSVPTDIRLPMPRPTTPTVTPALRTAPEPVTPVAVTASPETLWRESLALPSPEREARQLDAVEALLDAGQGERARLWFDAIPLDALSPTVTTRRALVEARLALYERRPNRANAILRQLEPLSAMPPALYASFYDVKSQVQAARGEPLAAAASLVRRGRYLTAPQDVLANQSRLWDVLQRVEAQPLREAAASTADPVLRGWLELALIGLQYAADPYRRDAALAQWRAANPGHPASDTVVRGVAAAQVAGPIALLLPMSSRYGDAAQAVYRGFLAMHEANGDPAKPRVLLYDIGEDPALAPRFYEQALREGARTVVGPLGREAVERVAQGSGGTTTLLLGDLPAGASTPPGVFQFGLNPEPEAAAAATRAWFDGHRQALVLAPDSAWGGRMSQAFTREFERLGGVVMETQNYSGAESDHSLPIMRLLNIDESEARKNVLEAALGMKLEFEPRRREDVDFIFLAADVQQGRQINPQLRFYRAIDVPVYATSHVFSGKPDALYDTDLNGVTFGDIPWMISNSGRIAALRQTIQSEWPGARTQLDRLYALGVDAYLLLPHLQRLRQDPGLHIDGATGSLSVDADGRVQHQLVWARFEKGLPVPLENRYGQLEWPAARPAPRLAATPAAGAQRRGAGVSLPAGTRLAAGGAQLALPGRGD